jgi:DNA-binding CsgD family transcriptional regulator/tetratricopeptide (TPR) repeat protein
VVRLVNTQDCVPAVLRRQMQNVLARDTQPRHHSPMAGAPISSATSPVMYGRDADSARINDALEALAKGQPSLVLISGEAGIGKTRLIDEALEGAGASIRVLRGECLALGAGIPYLPFAEILRDLVRQVPGPTLSRIIGPTRAELARFLPEAALAGGGKPEAAPAAVRSDELERLRLYEAFLRVAERIATEEPTVFVIEDVQWIDRASLELLSFLAHGLRQVDQAGLIVSVRPEETEEKEQVLTLLAELSRSGNAERIELRPLDAEATQRVAAAILGGQPPPPLMRQIHERSDGNPLFVEELLAASQRADADGHLPPKLRDLLAARLAQVPADVLEVLRVAAAVGRSIDDRLFTRASELDENQVRRAVRTAVDDHILVRGETGVGMGARPGYRFRHEILRALVASQLLPDEAQRIHAAYAKALSEEPAGSRSATEIANHWDAAGEPELALPAHVEAGRAAVAALAFGQARDHYDRALELWAHVADALDVAGLSRSDLLGDAASAAARAGAFDHAIELTRALIADPDLLDTDTYELARSSLRWYLWESGDLDRALSEAEAVVANDSGMPDRWRANGHAHMAALLLYEQRTDEAEQRAIQAGELARSAGAIEEQILAEGVLGWCLLLKGDVDAGLAAIRRTLVAASASEGISLEGRYPVGAALAHSQLAVALELVGRLEEAHEVAVAGAVVASEQGVGRTFGSVLQASAARALYKLGRWDEAAETVEAALGEGAVGSGRISLLAVRALLATAQGRAQEAEGVLAEAESLINETTPLDVRRWLTAAGVELSIWRHEPVAALARMAFLGEDPETPAIVAPGGQPAMLDASLPYLLALGARACADAALEERAAGSEPGFSAMAEIQLQNAIVRARKRKALAEVWAGDLAMARAELERGTSAEPKARVRGWRTAVERLSGRPYSAAYARWRLAEAQLSMRDGRDAATPNVEAAMTAAATLGAEPLGEELRGLARRARLSLLSTSDDGVEERRETERPYGLTAREAEVLALVADGLSNQEIAERLFISPKTASVHVSNIYGKLGVESRVAAATIAHDLGLDVLPGETDA